VQSLSVVDGTDEGVDVGSGFREIAVGPVIDLLA